MSTEATVRDLRRQRNLAAWLAVFFLVAGLGITLPRSWARYRSVRAAQEELAELQSQISWAEEHITSVQQRILDLQKKIQEARKK